MTYKHSRSGGGCLCGESLSKVCVAFSQRNTPPGGRRHTLYPTLLSQQVGVGQRKREEEGGRRGRQLQGRREKWKRENRLGSGGSTVPLHLQHLLNYSAELGQYLRVLKLFTPCGCLVWVGGERWSRSALKP